MTRSFKPVKTPLYQQVLTYLRSEIANLPSGTRLEPEHAMAKRFSVSIVTIREALRILASENVIERHAGRGTFVSAANTRAPDARHIAILIDQDISHPQSSPFYLKMAQLIREHLTANQGNSRLYVGNNPPGVQKPDLNSPEFIADLKEEKIAGIVALLAQPSSQWMDEVERQQLPIVAFSNGGFPYRTTIQRPYMPDALSMLASYGCKKVAFVGWFGHAVDPAPCIADFQKQVQAAGMETRLPWICHDGNPCDVGAGWEKFRELWRASPEKPDGLIVSDDLLLKGVIPAVLELRIEVPEELHIVACTNKEVSVLCPFPISRLEVDPQECATSLADKLLTLLAGMPLSEPVTILPYYRLDESTFPQVGGDLHTSEAIVMSQTLSP